MKHELRNAICLSALAAILLFPSGASADTQQTSGQKQQIYAIKKDARYLYADVTSETQQLAITSAEGELFHQVNRYAAGQGTKPVTGQTLKSQIGRITMPRGNMYRAFVYLKKNDALAGAATSKPSPSSRPAVVSKPTTHRDITIARLLDLTRGSELRDCLTQLRQQGHVEEFNSYRNLTSANDYILIIYNTEGRIEAVLSEGLQRKNLRTGAAEGVANYPGRGAIGVKAKK